MNTHHAKCHKHNPPMQAVISMVEDNNKRPAAVIQTRLYEELQENELGEEKLNIKKRTEQSKSTEKKHSTSSNPTFISSFAVLISSLPNILSFPVVTSSSCFLPELHRFSYT
ncbi:hypothetical protein BT63DRAFT_112840 [Microthyrium microscopicum]|uniref:Uncharacterized protein n=1 Tax=Microthyrium microscopicum TaxID=703497 RepID=A0A6A6TXW9_9PEZI|nr:hypothetical protein BT63DRAFT_112840 [Microthyrium microscopicum]